MSRPFTNLAIATTQDGTCVMLRRRVGDHSGRCYLALDGVVVGEDAETLDEGRRRFATTIEQMTRDTFPGDQAEPGSER